MRQRWMSGLAMLVVGLLIIPASFTSRSVTAADAVQAPDAAMATTAPSTQPSAELKTPKDKVSYALGVEIARGFKQQEIELSVDAIAAGIKDATAGGTLLMTEDELRKSKEGLQADLRIKRSRNRLIAAQDNKQEGEDFLAKNKTKEGVVTLPSGLQYKILTVGKGPVPKDGDTVECQYRGTLINGTEFDSSFSTGNPATFNVSAVIPGWKEALKLMPVGSKWQLFIPSQLAYGQRGTGRDIGPNTMLIFELDLLAIKTDY